jgi:hypothetical protein
MELANGSRVLSLPADEGTIRDDYRGFFERAAET